MRNVTVFVCLAPLLFSSRGILHAADAPASTKQSDPQNKTDSLLPAGWNPALAGDEVLQRLVNVTPPGVRGAHDAEFVCVGDHAYVVKEANDTQSGESAFWPDIYCTLSIVNLRTLKLEEVVLVARGNQEFANVTLPVGACFVPRILRKDESTLRCYFASEQPGKRQSQTWYRDFDLKTCQFEPEIHKVKLKTAAGTFDMQPQHLHADAVAQGFQKPAQVSAGASRLFDGEFPDYGLYLFDSFKKFDGKTYVAINNWPGHQNALAVLHDDLATVEVLGHYFEPQAAGLSESAVQRLPDGTWMAICRSEGMGGNYRFTTSTDGRTWAAAHEMPMVPNGISSKPTFNKFGDLYYLGWQEGSSIYGVPRSVFNIDISRDGKHWERKYRFETPKSFQYPTFHEHDGDIWLTVTQGYGPGSHKERIMFGQLERVGEFASQVGKTRQPIPVPPSEMAPMKVGVKLFTDRAYLLQEAPQQVMGLEFLRASIERNDVRVAKPGLIYALTPAKRPEAASPEDALVAAGFTKVNVPEAQLFEKDINRVLLYSKQVKEREQLRFGKFVILIPAEGAALEEVKATDAASE